MVVPADGAVTGWAALAWERVRWVDGCDTYGNELPVTILTPGSQARVQAGIDVSKERMLPRTRQLVDGVMLTDPHRSTAFEVRRAATPLAAVRWLDLVAASDLISLAEMTAYAETLGGWTGVDHLRQAISLADENVWSPSETDLRLTLKVRMGIAGVVSNRPVFDLDGRHIGTPDALDLERGMVAEYDGAVHLAGKQRAKDLRRESAFRRVGLEYVTMVAADRRDPADFIRRAHEARARAHRTPVADRRWTIDPPGWWTPTHTVEMRRALADWQRERYLRARAG